MNPKTLLVAVLIIGALALVAVLGIIGLALTDHTVPDVLQNIAVGSLTGLVGLLVPSRDPGDL